jgi:hypothetical protein
MITFETGMDTRSRAFNRPTVARFNTGRGYRYCVIGTDYGHIHTSAGDVKTWASKSGAYRAAQNYRPL